MAFLVESALKEVLKFFLCHRRDEQFVVPVTGCSPWDDFVALRCQAGQHALALGHVQVVDDRGLIHSQPGPSLER